MIVGNHTTGREAFNSKLSHTRNSRLQFSSCPFIREYAVPKTEKQATSLLTIAKQQQALWRHLSSSAKPVTYPIDIILSLYMSFKVVIGRN
jgi:hypothetical protein